MQNGRGDDLSSAMQELGFKDTPLMEMESVFAGGVRSKRWVGSSQFTYSFDYVLHFRLRLFVALVLTIGSLR